MADEPKAVTLAEVLKEHPELQIDLNAKFEERAARGKEAGRKEAEAEFAPIRSELETTKTKLSELESKSATAAQFETDLKETLAGITSAIPEENRKRIPDLPDGKKLRYIFEFYDMFLGVDSVQKPVTPGGPKPPEANTAPVPLKFAGSTKEARDQLKNK